MGTKVINYCVLGRGGGGGESLGTRLQLRSSYGGWQGLCAFPATGRCVQIRGPGGDPGRAD